MVEISIAYEGQLRCSAVHGPSKAAISTDAPVDNHGRGEAFSPTDLVAAALGTCIVTIMGIQSQRQGLNIDGTKVRVQKEMAAAPVRRIGKLTVDIEVPVPVSAEQKERFVKAAELCPVKQSLHPDTQVSVSFHWTEQV